MQKMNTGYSAFSSGPEITQQIPANRQVPVVPTSHGIPTTAEDAGFKSDDNNPTFNPHPNPKPRTAKQVTEYATHQAVVSTTKKE